MPRYTAPLDDMRFVLNEVLEIGQLSRYEAFSQVDVATVNQFLEETAKLAENVLFPLNATGDAEGCRHDRDTKAVTTPAGFKEAYRQFCEAGLTGFTCDPQYGGLGMPQVVGTAISEMFCSANLAFGMYPGLSHGAYNALHAYGTDEQKDTYLPKLVTGEWSGTMCLTEPQCGTDLGLVKTKAAPQADGSYKITGTKIFISAGEHDLTGNIIHLVLAKIEGADTPPGIKGISLFVVPKLLPESLAANGVTCGRIEEKMGIHGNATCEINFESAKGWLVGEKHKGMKAMFVMMNEARLGVGLQGLGLSEVAYQNALAYALDRKQGQPIDAKEAGGESVAIINHPDVRRELLSIKAAVEGGRMLAYWVSALLDTSQKDPDATSRKQALRLVDLLTPIVKAHFTDNAVDNTNSAIQVFGGHGYIREHGMEQYNRDARITRLYEGTNGIQGLDLVGRKVLKENLMHGYINHLLRDLLAAFKAKVPLCLLLPVAGAAWKLRLATLKLQARALLGQVTGMGPVFLRAGAVATDYYKLASLVVTAHMWVKMVTVAVKKKQAKDDFYDTKIKTARFYMTKVLPQAKAHARAMCSGAQPLMDIPADGFGHGQTTIGVK